MVDTLALHGREKLGLADEWRTCVYETLNDQAFKITFCMQAGVCKSGPRKGKPKYDSKTKRVFICSIPEHRAWESAWCEKHDKCRRCFGEGELFVGWSAADGTRKKPCPVCNGTGRLQP